MLSHLLEHHGVPEVFAIKDKRGFENLRDTLDVELLGSDLRRLGIVVDAEDDLQSRWQSLRGILNTFGYPNVPSEPESLGTIIEHEIMPIVGIWVMPNNQIAGMLEDFAQFLIPPGDALLDTAQACVQEVMDKERRFPAGQRSKAVIHTWLAWQQRPGTPLGSAINERYLDAEAPHAQQLIAWVRRLFDLGAAEGR